MAPQTTAETFQTRFALPLDLLQAALRERHITCGSLADIEPFADLVESPGVLADSVANVLREVMSTVGMALTRMEMLELLCIAVGGTDVESSGPALRRSLRQMLVFVNGVLLSMQEPLPQATDLQALLDAHAPAGESGSVDESQETPEDFYVLESFVQAGSYVPFAGTAVPGRLARSPSGRASGSSAPEVEPAETQPAQDIVATVSPVFSACLGARPEELRTFAGAVMDTSLTAPKAPALGADESCKEPSFTDLDSADSEGVEADGAEADGVEPDEPAARTHKLLSQPALIACAAVVAFSAGMLVPRSTPPVKQGSSEQPARSYDSASIASQSGQLPLVSATAGISVAPATLPLQPGSQALASVAPDRALANLMYSPQPAYPTLAQLTDVEGEVVLAITVSSQGAVVGTRVLQGQPLLRGAAEQAVRHWKFRPFLQNGTPAEIQTSVVVDVRPPLQ